MRRLVIFLLASVFLSTSPSGAQDNPHQSEGSTSPLSEDSNSRVVSFLQQSHDLNPQFNLPTRIYLLQRQAEAVSRVDAELGQAWAQELFALSRQTKGDLRSFAENASMSILVRLNPDRALALLHNLSKDEPQADAAPSLPNTQFVQKAFDMLVKHDGVGALPVLEQEAARMGTDGRYPYTALGHAAMQSVSGEWATNRPHAVEVVQEVFERAFDRYSGGPRNYMDDFEFGRMLQEVAGGLQESVRPALRLLVKNLLTTDTNKYQFHAEVYTTDGKTAKADNAIDAAILDLGGLIHRIDPELAKQLESERPQLQTALEYARDDRQRLKNFGPKWWLSMTTRPPRGKEADEDARMDAMMMSNINPEAAIAKAEQLPEGSKRADTVVEIARGIAGDQPERAQELIAEVEGSNKTDIPELQIEVISAKASVAAAQDKKDELRELLQQGFALATPLITELKKSGDVAFVRGLPQLVQTGMKNDPDSTITFVQGLPPSWLKANLLLGVAGALDRQRRQPVGPQQTQRSPKSNQ
jgi:hypothetical protein